MFDLSSLFGGMGIFGGSVPFNPEERSGDEQSAFDWQQKLAKMGKMAPYLASVQGSPQMQAPQARAPQLNGGQVQPFAGMTPYQGLLKQRPRSVSFGGL